MDHLERRMEAYVLDRSQIEDLLHSIHHAGVLASFELIPSGKCNTNYILRFNGNMPPQILRLYVRDPSACALEWQLYHMLRESVPMPEMHCAVFERSPQGAPPFALLSYAEGVPLADYLAHSSNSPEPLAIEIGSILATISKRRFQCAGFFNTDLIFTYPFTDVVDGYLTHLAETLFHGETGRKLGFEWVRQIWGLYEGSASLLDMIRESAELVHADFGLWNIIVKEDHKGAHVSAVLDWEFAHSGTCLLDVGHLLRYKNLLPDRFESSFISGFTDSGGSLPNGWRRIAALLDLMCLCDMMNSRNPQPAWDRECLDLIRNTLTDWDAGALN